MIPKINPMLNRHVFSVIIFVFISFNLFSQGLDESIFSDRMHKVKDLKGEQIERYVALMQKAEENDPENLDYPYEIAYAFYVGAKYGMAIHKLETMVRKKTSNDKTYQLLGICYKKNGEHEKAVEAFDRGLKVFPSSGMLHLERGFIEFEAGNTETAISYFEKGLNKSPRFALNYFWAAKLNCESGDKSYGLVYGEMFMNLAKEKDLKRVNDISMLMFNTYKEGINFNEAPAEIKFCKNKSSNLEAMNGSDVSMPFCIEHEKMLSEAISGVNSINLATLNDIRKKVFSKLADKEQKVSSLMTLTLYREKINKAGYFEAYNYWVLKSGDEKGFEKWKSANGSKFSSFIKWKQSNTLLDFMN